jgi:hypothetical protein
LTKSPESGGQSTGLVRHSDELRTAPRAKTRSRSTLSSTMPIESPRFEPMPTRISTSAGHMSDDSRSARFSSSKTGIAFGTLRTLSDYELHLVEDEG